MAKKINLYPKREAFGPSEALALKRVIKYYRNKKEDPPYHGKFEYPPASSWSRVIPITGHFLVPIIYVFYGR